MSKRKNGYVFRKMIILSLSARKEIIRTSVKPTYFGARKFHGQHL